MLRTAGIAFAAADCVHAAGTRWLAQPPTSTKNTWVKLSERTTSSAAMLPSPVLYRDPEAHPPVNTMPTPKMSPPMTEYSPMGEGWNVLFPKTVTPADTRLKSTMAIMMPTAMRGTPTANRSRMAEAMQKRPYCRHMPYANPNQRYAEK